mgnify:CR=1 FL=1
MNDQDRYDYEVTRELQELAYGKQQAEDPDRVLLEEAVAKLNEYMLELMKYGYVLKAGEDLCFRIVDRLFDKAAGK